MKISTAIICLGAAVCTGVAAGAEPLAKHRLIEELATLVRKHSPDAEITKGDGEFAAKHGTMQFTMHSRSKTGEVYERTYKQEGPNYIGFMLEITLAEGVYGGAAVTPQTLKGPYFPTYIDAIPTPDGKGYYWVRFSYGGRLNPEFKKAIFAALPNRFAGAPEFRKKGR